MDIEKILFDARAQLTWGKSEQEVKVSMLEKGIPEHVIDEFIVEIQLENNEVLREKGLRSLVISIPLLTLAAIGFVMAGRQLNGQPIIFGRLPIFLILFFGCPGLYQFISAWLDLTKHRRVRRQLSAMLPEASSN